MDLSHPSHKICRSIFKQGILPALEVAFAITPDTCYFFAEWHQYCRFFILRKLDALRAARETCLLLLTASDAGVQLTFYPAASALPTLHCVRSEAYYYVTHEYDSFLARAAPAVHNISKHSIATAHKAIRRDDPNIATLGDPRDLNNYLPDSGATQHMTPRLADLLDVVGGQKLGVEVADGHIINCSSTGKIIIQMYDDDGVQFSATLTDVMYVPGLSRRLFSITKFARHGHYAIVKHNATTLYFDGANGHPVTILAHNNGNTMASDISVISTTADMENIPSSRNRDHSTNRKRISLELLHRRLGHRKCRTLLAASNHQLWEDTAIRMSPETGCLSCGIATIKATARNKEPHTGASLPGEYAFLDIQHPILTSGLTPATSYAFYLFIVDAYSRYACLYGLSDKSTHAVVQALQLYEADHKPTQEYGYINLDRIRTDAGSQFTSAEFCQYCIDHKIQLSIAAPKKLQQNHLAERTWNTICSMARSMLVHARLPDNFWFHALKYSTAIFNVLPIRGMTSEGELPSTPYAMFLNRRPCINHFRVFGCPVVVKRWKTGESCCGKQTERGTWGIFVGFPSTQKGYLVFSPQSRHILISADIQFDESFQAAVATTWQQHKDSLALQPLSTFPPDADATLEHTGTIANIPTVVEEGGEDTVPAPAEIPGADPAEHLDAFDEDEDDFNEVPSEYLLHQPLPPPQEEEDSPFILDSSASQLRRSTRPRRPNPRYCDLAVACTSEAYHTLDSTVSDALSWEPAPRTIRDIMKLPPGMVRTAWLKSVKAELKNLVDAKTFVREEIQEGETCTPIMETFKVKIRSGGTLDKLKTRLVVRGDLQSKSLDEDTWSPTASFRSLKMFLAHASRLKVRDKQLDFIGAFLQANVRARIFVQIPKIFGILFPEYSDFCGTPLRLAKSMYGMTLSGKYWFLDLKDYLLEQGFIPSGTVKCLFFKKFDDGAIIIVLNYVDDMLYYGDNESKVKEFEELLQKRFNLELLGQAHWYLATRISQKSNFDIEIDQTRYCLSILRKYLDTAGCKRDTSSTPTPLPLDFVPSSEDCSDNDEMVAQLEAE